MLVALLGLAGLAGALPTEPRLPPPPDQPPVDSWPFGVAALLLVAAALVWLRARTRLVPRVRATPEEELAAYAVAFVALLMRLRPHGAGLARTASCSCSPRSTPGSGCRSFGARPDG